MEGVCILRGAGPMEIAWRLWLWSQLPREGLACGRQWCVNPRSGEGCGTTGKAELTGRCHLRNL